VWLFILSICLFIYIPFKISCRRIVMLINPSLCNFFYRQKITSSSSYFIDFFSNDLSEEKELFLSTTTAAINLLDFSGQLSFAKFYIGIYNLKTWFKEHCIFITWFNDKWELQIILAVLFCNINSITLKSWINLLSHLLIITEDDSTTLIEFAFNKASFSAKSNSSVSIGIIRDILLSLQIN
jgi:hypothetical protein